MYAFSLHFSVGAQVDMDEFPGCQATSCRSSPVSFGSLQVMNKVLGPLAAPSRTRKHDLACTAAFGTLLGRARLTLICAFQPTHPTIYFRRVACLIHHQVSSGGGALEGLPWERRGQTEAQ